MKNEIQCYSEVARAIEVARAGKLKVVVKDDHVIIGIYEVPCYTAREIHHYLNGVSDGRGRFKP